MNEPLNILELLYDRREGFFSLDELSGAVNTDAGNVRSQLGKLQERGHEIEFSPTDGVRLARPVKPEANLIERNLSTKRVGKNVICFDEVESTNDVAMSSADNARADGLVVLAESQSKGRGRFARTWLSRLGENILMSVLLVDNKPVCYEALTIAAGLAVAEGISLACGLDCRLKWPNDVLIDDAKIAGVLVDAAKSARMTSTVIGVGINVNSHPPIERVTCIARHMAEAIERIDVIRMVLQRLDVWIGDMASIADADLHDAWLARCDMINKRITAKTADRIITARVLDIHPTGGMVVADDDGNQIILHAESTTILQ